MLLGYWTAELGGLNQEHLSTDYCTTKCHEANTSGAPPSQRCKYIGRYGPLKPSEEGSRSCVAFRENSSMENGLWDSLYSVAIYKPKAD